MLVERREQEGGGVTDTTEGRAPVAVPEEARRAGEAEAPARSYAEPSVWTERMLATLVEGGERRQVV